jgi:hypothetical protein
MKLYTEEQVLKIIQKTKMDNPETYYEILQYYKPIELPSDEEIEEKFTKINVSVTLYDLGYSDGAKWMKEQILNQNK